MSDKAIFLIGPTAVGKTELALRLAKYYPLEIISVDSALIYQDLDIGSAKPSAAELSQVPHHLINILSPLASYCVADFLSDTQQKIREINQRGNLALLVGGTMMYYNALINGISQLPEADLELRSYLQQQFSEHGNAQLHLRLQQLDPLSAANIQVNDTQRLGRALEVCLLTGQAMSQVQAATKMPGLVNCDYLPLAIKAENRQLLHQRINSRWEKMLHAGVIAEVQQLRLKYPSLTAAHNSMRCVGYRQVWDYLDGVIDFTTLNEQAQAATRQLAKRQITWLRSLQVVSVDDFELDLEVLLTKILALIQDFVSR